MLEEVWPEIGKAWVSGVLAGGGSILVQWLMPKAARLLNRLRTDKLRLERRLAAILAADVVGYSRLMSADEEGTHLRLLAYRREIIAPKVREHRGRIVKHTGDGALVEFGSVVDAVRCALDVQRVIRARNAGLPQDRTREVAWTSSDPKVAVVDDTGTLIVKSGPTPLVESVAHNTCVLAAEAGSTRT